MGNFSSIEKLMRAPDGTAQGVAKVRLQELLAPEEMRICQPDPYASGVVRGAGWFRTLGFDWLQKHYDRLFPGLYQSIACRTRFLDDHIEEAVTTHGVSQVVILGAGYDMRFYRLKCFQKADMNLIEIDQSYVQNKKKAALKRMGVVESVNGEGNIVAHGAFFQSYISCAGGGKSSGDEAAVETCSYLNVDITPEIEQAALRARLNLGSLSTGGTAAAGSTQHRVQFCPCNFETMSLAEQIAKTNFDGKRKTLIVMEGLSQYVEKNALGKTVETLTGMCQAAGSILLLSYVDGRTLQDPIPDGAVTEKSDKAAVEKLDYLLKTMVAIAEPWITGFDVQVGKAYEMQQWIRERSNGKFVSNYKDESWDEFAPRVLVPLQRDLSKLDGKPLGRFCVERHVRVESA